MGHMGGLIKPRLKDCSECSKNPTLSGFARRLPALPHLNVVVSYNVVVLVNGGLEQLVAVFPLDANTDEIAAVFQELTDTLPDLDGGEEERWEKDIYLSGDDS